MYKTKLYYRFDLVSFYRVDQIFYLFNIVLLNLINYLMDAFSINFLFLYPR
ncbi:hypothetical protein CBO05C_0763 [Clostridium botulinum B str. Osaka05]|uniref:Uncharacterized protein n=1 Tax=Clostridium botulinum B str. Osaka05 TaxID=1407017 RepID=A0A0S6TZL4_CLOBO|nr:hypothetical protein CBO05C_0763 [Clostridium botulinum B str. Osaka05]